VPADENHRDNLREKVWSYALDQRAFGPRKMLTAFADADGLFRGIAHTDRTDPPLLALEACLSYQGIGRRRRPSSSAMKRCRMHHHPGSSRQLLAGACPGGEVRRSSRGLVRLR